MTDLAPSPAPGAASTPAPLRVYAGLMTAAEPLTGWWLGRRVRLGKEDPLRLGERLGRTRAARPEGALAWLHGASVGETLSLLPLADRLMSARPELSVLVTSGTRTAAALAAERLPPGAAHQYAPLDTPGAARRFLDHWRPDFAVFAESELWPNLILEAKRRGVRLALVSAKLSEASFRNWRRAPRSAERVIGAFDMILAQDPAGAERLSALGGSVVGIADLKFGAPPLPSDPGRVAAIRACAGGARLIVAASTHPDEERIIAEAFTAASDPNARLVIVPRHPERGAAVAADLVRRGVPASLQSRGEALGPAVAHVADALGELGAWYSVAALVVMGGAFVPGVGGHNPLEPARIGAPVISGTEVANWRSVYAALADADATALVTADGLRAWLDPASPNASRLPEMAARAAAFVAARDREALGVADLILERVA